MKSKNQNKGAGASSNRVVSKHAGTLPGFTLVELLVVVAVLSILIAMLLGGTHKVREKSEATQCLGNQRRIISAMLLYAGENDGRLFPYSDSYYPFDPLNPYLDVPTGKRIGVEALACRTAKRGYSYGVNYGPTAEGIGVFGYEDRDGFAGSLRLSQLSTKTVVFGESSENVIYNPANWGLKEDPSQTRHGGGFNCAFGDGSVRHVSKAEWHTNNSPLWNNATQ
jgi:prepilin-type N-terminal cleavage/methylation domain-containing protein/prepilin-type processing-associated H-X9-DG protein